MARPNSEAMGAIVDRIETDELSRLHWLGIALTATTGLIHLGLGLATLPTPLGVASVLAGFGFGVAILLILWNVRVELLALLGVPYVASQIVLWYVVNQPASLSDVSPVAAVDKVVQVLLIAVIVAALLRRR